MGSSLNIGQFAQAENLPANLLGVTMFRDKAKAFEFKFVELLLDVAGAQGHLESSGAKVMVEPVFQNFMLARQALLKVIDGASVRASYDEMLSAKSNLLQSQGYRVLNVADPHDRALARLLCLRRATTLAQALELESAFQNLPLNARAILIHELNKDGVGDGWGTLPYYAPALFVNANSALKDAEEGSLRAISTVLLALARVFQDARILAREREGDGVLTVNLESLARFVLTPEFKADPDSLLDQKYELFANPGDPDQYGVRLSPRDEIRSSAFIQMRTLTQLPGKNIAVIGIGGGSDGVQAAQLALLLQASGKHVKFVGSVRTGTRTVENHGGEISDGIFKILRGSSGSGRFLENIPAGDVPMYLILDKEPTQRGYLESAIEALIKSVGGIETLITVDTGGDSLYSPQGDLFANARATPDQDLRVLGEVAKVRVPNLISTIIAAGVDSPVNAQRVLLKAKAQYYEFSPIEKQTLLDRYQTWDMQGQNSKRFGKTPLAWQLALKGERGLRTLPLPTSVVTDEVNPWNPFVQISQSMSGMFVMSLKKHLALIP